MKLVLGRLSKLDKCLYITNRIKPNSKPCISIPIQYAHLLLQALREDGVITANDAVELLNDLADSEEERVDLELLERISLRRNNVFLYLRGFFSKLGEEEAVEKNGNLILPIIPGLANTSLIQVFTFRRDRYVIDIRDFNVSI